MTAPRLFHGVLVAATLFALHAPLAAHHSMVAQFSVDKPPLTLRGTVTKFVWLNPHGELYLDVKTSDGRVENWMVETGAPLRMVKRGLKQTDFSHGTEVIVMAYPSRTGERTAAGMVVTFVAREGPNREASFSLGR